MNTAQEQRAICKCNICSTQIRFAASRAGENITCPNCGMDTQLFIGEYDTPPEPEAAPFNPNLRACSDCGRQISVHATACPQCGAPTARPAPVEEKSNSILGGYLLAVFLPFIGFFFGIYMV